MDKLHFTQNSPIIIELNDISAESAFDAILVIFRQKYPFTEIRSSYNAIKKIIKPCSLSAFNDLRDLLEAFVVKYPLTEIEQRP